MSECQAEGCTNPIFSKGFCKYHQFIRRMKGGDLYGSTPSNKRSEARSPKRRTLMPLESKKRQKEHKYYTQECKELEQELRELNGGKIYCFFSGEEIQGIVTFHHTNKRTGKFYLDKKWLVPCINEHHLAYHFTPVEKLMKKTWYNGFLQRLRNLSEELYQKEMKKFEKANVLFEENLDI